MQFERKVKVGDVKEENDIVSKVQAINLRPSVLLTRDGDDIIVPNHKFIIENVINLTYENFQRRFHIEVGVSYSNGAILVSSSLLNCVDAQKEFLSDEKHRSLVRLHDFGDNALVFYLMFWTTDIFHIEQVKSLLRYRILKSFRDNNITIPFP